MKAINMKFRNLRLITDFNIQYDFQTSTSLESNSNTRNKNPVHSVCPVEFLSLKIPHDRIVIQMIGHRPSNGIHFR